MRINLDASFDRIREAASHTGAVTGLTHQFYKYPARFSPKFAAAAIEEFSSPGQLVLDPYMGGGTTVVEALAAGRCVVGCDLNSLAVFVAKAKTLDLTKYEITHLTNWATKVIPTLNYHQLNSKATKVICPERTQNLNIPRARAIKKYLALAITSCNDLQTNKSKMFARCALLNVSQWALDGRKQTPALRDFRSRIHYKTLQMLEAAKDFSNRLHAIEGKIQTPHLIHNSAEYLPALNPFSERVRADLVITSPPILEYMSYTIVGKLMAVVKLPRHIGLQTV